MAWRSGNAFHSINAEPMQWVTVCGQVNHLCICNQPPRSTQLSIFPGKVNRVPAYLAEIKAGAFTCVIPCGRWRSVVLWGVQSSKELYSDFYLYFYFLCRDRDLALRSILCGFADEIYVTSSKKRCCCLDPAAEQDETKTKQRPNDCSLYLAVSLSSLGFSMLVDSLTVNEDQSDLAISGIHFFVFVRWQQQFTTARFDWGRGGFDPQIASYRGVRDSICHNVCLDPT